MSIGIAPDLCDPDDIGFGGGNIDNIEFVTVNFRHAGGCIQQDCYQSITLTGLSD
jgi:hypothetical protein